MEVSRMSDLAVYAAIERIMDDPDFALQVLRDPEGTLKAYFDLQPNELRTIHQCLLEDLEESLGEVQGLSLQPENLASVTYQRLQQLRSAEANPYADEGMM
jgi:hypothetical protein